MTEERVVRAVAPAGAAWSISKDIALCLKTLMTGGLAADGKRVDSEASLAKVWSPHSAEYERPLPGYRVAQQR